MTSLGLGVITRNKDIDGLRKALDSISGQVDKIYITVADLDEPTIEMQALAVSFNAHISWFKWRNDFAAARNFNMSQCKEEWYTWLDSDDTVQGMEHAKALLMSLPPKVQYVLCTYNYSFTPTGKVAVHHPKERFMRNNGLFSWKGRLHESCVTASQEDGIKCDDIVWNHDKDATAHVEACRRNVIIIEEELHEQIEAKNVDPRSVFNLGMAYASIAQLTGTQEDWERVVKTFHKYLEKSGWDEHAFMAWKYVGIAQMQLKHPSLAEESFMQALRLKPQYAEAYAMLGGIWEAMDNTERAEAWYKAALLVGEENKYAADISTSLITPLYGLAQIAAKRGKIEEAIQYLKHAIKYTGKDDKMISGMLQELKRIRSFLKEAQGKAKMISDLPESEQKAAFDALELRFKSHPALIAVRRSKKWKTDTTGKELVFFGTAWEEWTPDMVKTGVGGSEEAMVYLTQELKKQGWTITVYGNHGECAKEYNGVMYRPWWEWSPEDACDVFVSWRDPNVFEQKVNAKKKYLWLHDTNPEASINTKTRLENIDKIIVLSKYHRELYPNIADDKFFLSSNGLLPEHFQVGGIERNPKKILYTSAPNRGLGCLLDMWPKIKAKVPDAELCWYYGWDTFDLMQKNNPNAARFKAEMKAKLNQPGITEGGRIGHEELAKEMLSAGVWAYPTEFTEIFCITAIKMQAAGCWPVTTNVAALNEVVAFGTKFECDDIYANTEMQSKFVDEVVKRIESAEADSDDTDSLGENMRESMVHASRDKWSWQSVASKWNDEFLK